MDSLLNRLGSKVNSILTGFDRIVFKGSIRPITHADGMESFLVARRIQNKDFKSYAVAQSQAIVQSAEQISREQCGNGIIPIQSLKERKEALAHEQQKKNGTEQGLIGIWSCVESCNTFRSTYDAAKTYPALSAVPGRCKHLYFYFDDPVYGFMSIRMQTWAPYEIQIALNGREWLRRSLDKAGCGYHMSGNKFLHIDDPDLAQGFLDQQARVEFEEVLRGFLPGVFPRMPEILGPGLSYYWTLWQSEVAKDYIFKSADALCGLMADLQLHALVTGKGSRILKFFGCQVRSDGQPLSNRHPKIRTRTTDWYDGLRVRHWYDRNSVKFYNEHNVLRFEMTMNDPTRFMIYRYAQNQSKSGAKKLRPMRKGIADTAARTEVSKNILDRFTEHMSAFEEKSRLGELLSLVSSPFVRGGKRIRALDVFGKDRELLSAISDPAFAVHGITNKKLQGILAGTSWAKNKSDKQLSSRISRHLMLLREQGLIKKLPNQRKYMLTDKGRRITAALDAASATSVNDLLKLAA